MIYIILFLIGCQLATSFEELNFSKSKGFEVIRLIETSEYNDDFLIENLDKANALLIDFTKENGYIEHTCKNNKLFFYIDSIESLNSLNIIPINKVDEMWGLYDSKGDFSYITLTPHGEEINEKLIAHEYAHYWYDMRCWGIYTNKDTESIALEFEEYFSERK